MKTIRKRECKVRKGWELRGNGCFGTNVKDIQHDSVLQLKTFFLNPTPPPTTPHMSSYGYRLLLNAPCSAGTSFFSQMLLDWVQIAEQFQPCGMSIRALGAGLFQYDIIPNKAAVENNQGFQRWEELVSPAMGNKADQPILIIQGMKDTAVLPQITINAFNDTCEYGNEAQLSLYPDINHGDVLAASSSEWLSFLQERFEGTKSTVGGCKQTVNTPFDASSMVTKNGPRQVQGDWI